MKTIIAAVIRIALLLGAPSALQQTSLDVFAISAYESGFEHGVADAKCPFQNGCEQYITQPGKGFQVHTRDFINGFVNGYCSIAVPDMSTTLDTGITSTYAQFSCKEGPSSAAWDVINYHGPEYKAGFNVGLNDGLNEGIFHHAKFDKGHHDWSQGYIDGWSQGCRESGRSSENCGVQEDADTP